MNEHDEGRLARILLVEDSKIDAILLRQSMKHEGLDVELYHVENGVECMAFLRNEEPYAHVPRPDLILLDLNMPMMNGQEVLENITKDPALRHLPVIVLSTSTDQRDVLSMYQLRCNAYFAKPLDVDKFRRVLRNLFLYWFDAALLPQETEPDG